MDRFKKIIIKISKYVIGIVIVLLIGVVSLFGSSISVYASENDVISDLMIDRTFDINSYPSINNDYSLQVIQIAETINNTLVVYVYQPSHYSKDLIASHIDISYGFSQNGADLNPNIFELEMLSTNGVFDKYIVKDFKVNTSDIDRYYNIVSIYRKFDIDIDDLNDGLVDKKKAYGVGQQWYCTTINDVVHYEMNTFSYLDVESVYTGYQYMKEGYKWKNLISKKNACYAWFYIFNPKNIIVNGEEKSVDVKHIYDAELSYDIRTVRELRANGGRRYSYGDWTTQKVTLTDNDKMSYNGGGIFAKTFEWNRLMTASDFKQVIIDNNGTINDNLLDYLVDGNYVFSFLETDYAEDYNASAVSCYDYSEIQNTTLLRLHFLDNTGKQYDLGVVSDMLSSNNNPSVSYGTKLDDMLSSIGDWFKQLFSILGIIILVVILLFVSSLLTPVGKILGLIIKGILYVLSLPFRLIKWVFKH